MIGTKFIKENFDASDYAEAANWCNATQKARIEDKGDYYEVVAKVIPEVTLEEAKAAKLAEINDACDAILNQAVSTYPQSEILTFDQQIDEVEKYLSSGSPSDAPLLTALAAARGIELDDLCGRIIDKRTAFSQLSGWVIGQRQRLEDILDTLETVEDVQSLDVDISLPEPPEVENAVESETEAKEEAAEESGFFNGERLTDGAE